MVCCISVLGSCEMEEPSAKALSGGEERGYAVERGRRLDEARKERGYSSDRERSERGHSSEREENSGYRVLSGSLGQSGYSSSTEREGSSGCGAGGNRGHRPGVTGRGAAREKEERYSQNEGVSLPLTRPAWQSGERVGVARDRGFPVGHEEYRLVRERMGHSWRVSEREAGGPMTAQSLNVSVTESLRDTSYSSTVASQANASFSRGLEGSRGGKSITQGPGRPANALCDFGSLQRPLGLSTQAESPDTSGVDRQSELQYYITKVSRCQCSPIRKLILFILSDKKAHTLFMLIPWLNFMSMSLLQSACIFRCQTVGIFCVKMAISLTTYAL